MRAGRSSATARWIAGSPLVHQLGFQLLTLAARRILARAPPPGTPAEPASKQLAPAPAEAVAPVSEVSRPLDVVVAFAVGAATSAWLGSVWGSKNKKKKRKKRR